MLEQLSPRGPDAKGKFTDHYINLGHSRLSIIDLKERSNQPFFDKQTGNILIFNGEIYNFKEIKKNLIEQKRCLFSTSSDTEVVLKSYAYYGLDCFEKFDGMFAIAIWDSKQSKLILARDRFGEKPLFYSLFSHNSKKEISFASDLNSLKHSPKFNNEINKKSLKSYLINNYVNNSECFYNNSFNVEPGTILIFQNNKVVKKKYFEIKNFFKKKNNYRKFDYEEFDEVLTQSIKSRLVSDVDIGVFLSGGLDSSLIASIIKKQNINFKSFTLGFEEPSFDESDKAEYMSNYLDIKNEKFLINESNLDNIDKIIMGFGEPLADTSIIPTFLLSEFASKQVKVCLGGDGGDELFFGYDTYTASKSFDILKKYKLDFILKNLKFLKDILPSHKTKINYSYAIKKFIDASNYKNENFFIHEFWRTINDNKSLSNILNKNLFDEIKNIEIDHYDIDETQMDINSHRNMCDFKYFLERDILVKSDRCSMANSLELRSPFLSYDLFEYMSNLDPKEKFNSFNKKKILKKVAKKYIPEKLIRQKKRGFNAPVSQWINKKFGNYFKDLLYSDSLKKIFNTSQIELMLKENKERKDNGNQLFNIFCLAIWINNNKLKI